MRFFRASSHSPSIAQVALLYRRASVQECAGSHRRHWPTRLRAIGLPGQRGAASKVASNMSVLPQPVGRKLARACPRPPRAAMGCFLRATACLRHAGPTLARPSGLAVHGRSKSWIASSSRSGRGLTNSSRLHKYREHLHGPAQG